MDILNDHWICEDTFKDIESYSKFVMLCKFAGLKVPVFYENAKKCYSHYPGNLDTPGQFDTWEFHDWARKLGARVITIKQAEELLIKAINEQVKNK